MNFFKKNFGKQPKMRDPNDLDGNTDVIDDQTDESFYDDYGDVEPDNSRWELETQDVLDRFEHSLCNEKYNNKTGEWDEYKTKPKLNRLGVADTMADLRGIMHKATSLANINHDYCIEETKAEGKAYMRKLLYNMETWEVDKSQFEYLVLSITRMIHLSLTRPINDLERKHRNKRYQYKEAYAHDEVKASEIRL